MFNIKIGSLIGEALNSLDNVAKETLEDEDTTIESATAIRTAKKKQQSREKLYSDSSTTVVDGDTGKTEHGVDQVAEEEDLDLDLDIDLGSVLVPSNMTKDSPVVDSDVLRVSSSDELVSMTSLTTSEKDFRRTIKLKDKEIDRLNAECLELEDQVSALKKEVESAWKAYKTSQEQAADRESDLQDEVRQVQKAKQTDKEQLALQITDAAREVEDISKQLRTAIAEKNELQEKIDEMITYSREWTTREKNLMDEIEEAKKMSFSGALALQDQLRASEEAIEVLRQDHSTMHRQNQARQAELESANAELIEGLAERQREIDRLHRALSQAGSDEITSVARELDGLRQQTTALSAQLEAEREKCGVLESRSRTIECEARAAQLAFSDERLRAEETIKSMSEQISSFEDQLKQLSLLSGGQSSNRSSNNHPSKESKLDDLEEQVKTLSTQLLRKQGAVQELQSERSALKSRLSDMQNRAAKAEQQLLQLKDAEDEGDLYYDGGNSSSTSSLRRKGLAPGIFDDDAKGKIKGHKVLSGLEEIGVRIKSAPGVAKAVDTIDTWTLITGKFLRSYPLLRMGFVLYLVVLHLWVLLILVVKFESIDIESVPQMPRNIVHS